MGIKLARPDTIGVLVKHDDLLNEDREVTWRMYFRKVNKAESDG